MLEISKIKLETIKEWLELIYYIVAIISAIPIVSCLWTLREKVNRKTKIYDVKFNDGSELMDKSLFIYVRAKNLRKKTNNIVLLVNDKPYQLIEKQTIQFDSNTMQYIYAICDTDGLYAELLCNYQDKKYPKFYLKACNTKKRIKSTNVVDNFINQHRTYLQNILSRCDNSISKD